MSHLKISVLHAVSRDCLICMEVWRTVCCEG